VNLVDEPVWIDAETKVEDSPDDHRTELRLWLRLLTCSTLIETEIRRRLREEFDFTLPRFDVLAQLDRAPDGLVLGEVSKRLMVSAGNITAIAERLIQDGFITRTASPQDRRVQIIRMTPEGRKTFRRMAKKHGDWVASFFGDMPRADLDGLMAQLGAVKASVRNSTKK
jgi:DNA-binding MarR family transcriptional regulator